MRQLFLDILCSLLNASCWQMIAARRALPTLTPRSLASALDQGLRSGEDEQRRGELYLS